MAREFKKQDSLIIGPFVDLPLSYVTQPIAILARRGQGKTYTGYKRSSRDAYIQRLRTRELIVVDRDGVTASGDLF